MSQKDKYFKRLETLLKFLKNAKVIIVSPDVYKEMKLRGKSTMTSKGRLKVQIVTGYCILGVNDGTTKFRPHEGDIDG